MLFSLRYFLFFLFFPTLLMSESVTKNQPIKKYFDSLNFINPKPMINNFGMPELVFYNRTNETLFRSGLSFQLTPKIAVSFRYSGQGKNGNYANGRTNFDRSFDLHTNLLTESKYRPAVSFGLRDFVGTGWYSSEYIVGTKTIGSLGLTAGLGFGRLAGRNQITNPFSLIDNSFKSRSGRNSGVGGTLGAINWFHGPASPFAGISYAVNDKINLDLEYSPDLMLQESNYLTLKSPYNVGLSYNWSEMVSLEANYLHGSTVTIGANLRLNPKRAPNGNGNELAPVPMRKRVIDGGSRAQANIAAIESVLEADEFLLRGIVVPGDNIQLATICW